MSSSKEKPSGAEDVQGQPQISTAPLPTTLPSIPIVQKKAADLDPEIILQRKFRAKCQFRALYRLVSANLYWLNEDDEEYEGLDDVKRRVQQAVRSKSKKRRLLSIQDKAILNKKAAERTDSEKKYLYRIIGGLKCFKRYPNNVKRKLAALTYFKYYGPDRVIVRQHQEAHALYFIVTGDVSVSHQVYDEVLEETVSSEIGVMHAGDMFGEVSLLHNIPRTATVTTVGHCELLVLMKEDFKNVLQVSIQKSWDEVRRAMSAFTYFDELDEVALREGCIVAKMKSYAAGETILGDGMGIPNFVYFVLSGKCHMIETLEIIIENEDSEKDFEEKYFRAYKNLTGKLEESDSQVKTTSGILNKSGTSDNHSNQISKGDAVSQVDDAGGSVKPSSVRLSKVSARSGKLSEMLAPPREDDQRPSIKLSVNSTYVPIKRPPNMKKFFMQVCAFNPGSSFGFGENMRDRRIVALNNVSCMLMPKVWLLQRNTANIWTRIQYYLEKKIPTKKQLFKEFVEQRRWMVFKTKLVDDVVSRHNTVNWTTCHDIPYSIRMDEVTYASMIH